jgi:hypothetical protein
MSFSVERFLNSIPFKVNMYTLENYKIPSTLAIEL